MKILRNVPQRRVTVQFENSFNLRDAINLPKLISKLPLLAEIVLDFSDVRWVRESAMVALIPALASLHGRKLKVVGLESAEAELSPLLAAA